jgi:hypothetical protein
VCVYVCVCVCVYVCMYVCMYVCVCVYRVGKCGLCSRVSALALVETVGKFLVP